MKLFRKVFLGDPYRSGAQIFTDDEVLERLRRESSNEPIVAPYAKTIGFVLHPPKETTVSKRRKRSKR